MSVQNFDLQDKIKGSLAGVFIGDAAGAPYEFSSSPSVSTWTGKISIPYKIPSRFHGNRTSSLGQVTDDSEMTISLIDSLIRNKKYDRDDVILSYQRWANSHPGGMGKNTRRLFQGVKTVQGYQTRYERYLPELQETQSNGSLMRCTPLAIFSSLNPAMEDCLLTNPTNNNLDCEYLYLIAIRNLYLGKSLEEILPLLLKSVQTEEVKLLLDSISKKESRSVKSQKGWVLHAFYCAFYCLINFSDFGSFEKCLNFVISLGGDTDTNAAIMGGLIGAYLGYSNMGQESSTRYNLEVILKGDTSSSQFPRPSEYFPSRLDELSQGLCSMFQFK